MEYQKNHLLKELAIVAEKLKYLEDKNYRMAVGASNKNTDREYDSHGIPRLKFEEGGSEK